MHHSDRSIVTGHRGANATEAMFARHVRGAPTHEALMLMDDGAVGRHLADVPGHSGHLDVEILASLSYDPRRRDGYASRREPGPDVTEDRRRGLKVLVEGWEWLVREGLMMRASAGPGWELTRRGEAMVGDGARASARHGA